MNFHEQYGNFIGWLLIYKSSLASKWKKHEFYIRTTTPENITRNYEKPQ